MSPVSPSAAPVPRASASWFKAHGLGNDYLVFREGDDWALSPESIRAVCDRWRGVGSDGIVLELAGDPPPFRLRMFNPDGSEFERSGNGLRVFGAALATGGRIGEDPFRVDVGGGSVVMRLHGAAPGGEWDLSVELGRASFDPDAIGFDPARLDDGGRIFHPEFGTLPIRPVSVGNPHCVVFMDDLSERALGMLGPALTTHPAFREGTNVQLARVEPGQPSSGGGSGTSRLRIAIWERGVGRTSASGTSACAVAAAAVHEGRIPAGEVEVLMEGGVLRVTVGPDYGVTLRGPVREVSRGELAPGFLEFLSGVGADR